MFKAKAYHYLLEEIPFLHHSFCVLEVHCPFWNSVTILDCKFYTIPLLKNSFQAKLGRYLQLLFTRFLSGTHFSAMQSSSLKTCCDACSCWRWLITSSRRWLLPWRWSCWNCSWATGLWATRVRTLRRGRWRRWVCSRWMTARCIGSGNWAHAL